MASEISKSLLPSFNLPSKIFNFAVSCPRFAVSASCSDLTAFGSSIKSKTGVSFNFGSLCKYLYQNKDKPSSCYLLSYW